MKHLLESYQLQRFKWAFEAKEDYLSRFRIFEAEKTKSYKKRLVISVYGPTQVGKSTLILTLIGVKDKYLNRVSKFLRGKRDAGKSATVTVTVYQVSPTDYFQIKLPFKEVQTVKTEEELENLLAQLRYDIEEGVIQSIEPVIIAIPNYMFEESEQILEIIDLPGIESAEKKEIQHIERCISYWIPNSHICLIVNSANDLTFLRDIEMPQLMNWHEYEDNYFLVLTRAMTPKSIQLAIQEDRIQTSEDLIEYYKDYIENILNHRKGTVFPLEIGDSFKNLEGRERKITDDSLKVLKKILHETEIYSISFNTLTSYYRDVLRQEEGELKSINKRLEEQLKFIEELKSNQRRSCKKNKKKLSKEKEDVDSLNSKLRIIQNRNISFAFYKSKIEKVMKESPVSMRASGANKLVTNLIVFLEDEVNKEIKILNKSFKEIANEFQLKNLKLIEHISIDFTFWDNSKINKYFSEVNYLKKRRVMGSKLYEALEEKWNAVEKEILKRLKIIQHLKTELEYSIHYIEVSMQSENNQYKEALEKENARKITLMSSLDEVNEMWERDKNHALQYKDYFIEHLIKRKNQLLKMATSEEYEQQYLSSLFLQVLGEDAKKIINSMEIEHNEHEN